LITYVDTSIEIEDGKVKVRRDLDTGWEIVAAELPLLLTITHTANTPRPPSIKRMMRLKKARSRPEIETRFTADVDWGDRKALDATVDKRVAELKRDGLLIKSWTLDDIDAKSSRCGLRGSPTKVYRVQSVALAAAKPRRFKKSDKGIAKLVGTLLDDHTIG
jgi:electron transfer flavoprotein beta subunit